MSSKSMRVRLLQLEREAELQEPLIPWLVILEDEEGGYNAKGEHYGTIDEARLANPDDYGGLVVVEIMDGRIEGGVSHG